MESQPQNTECRDNREVSPMTLVPYKSVYITN